MAGIPSYCQAQQVQADGGVPDRLRNVSLVLPECVNGVHGPHTVNVRIGGHGMPLVIAHGILGSSKVYGPVLSGLAQWFKVIGVDLAGHGGTQSLARNQNSIEGYVDLLGCTLDALGVARAVLVGHSLGGQVVTGLASRDPDRMIALGLANAIVGETWDRRVEAVRRSPVRWRAVPVIWQVSMQIARLLWNIRRTDGDDTLRALSADTFARYMLHPWHLLPPIRAILHGPPTAPMLRTIGERHPGDTFVLLGDSDPIVTLAEAMSTVRETMGHFIGIEDADHNWPLARRGSLPGIMLGLLDGSLESHGELASVLDKAVVGAGLSPACTQTDIENSRYFYRDGAQAVTLTQPGFMAGSWPLGWRAAAREFFRGAWAPSSNRIQQI